MNKVLIALLADFALAHPDGKFYITGGGIETLRFASFPAAYPHLSLALKIEFGPGARTQQHIIEVRPTGPQSEPFARRLTVSYAPIAGGGPQPDEPTTVQFVYNVDNVSFPVEGPYQFAVVVDGHEAVIVPVRARLSPEAEGPTADWQTTMAEKLQSGFDAFNRGEKETAERIFRELVSEFKGAAVAHNNLGFVLLATGRAGEALESFKRAGELAFERPELLDANTACCLYLSQNFESVLSQIPSMRSSTHFPQPGGSHGHRGAGAFPGAPCVRE